MKHQLFVEHRVVSTSRLQTHTYSVIIFVRWVEQWPSYRHKMLNRTHDGCDLFVIDETLTCSEEGFSWVKFFDCMANIIVSYRNLMYSPEHKPLLNHVISSVPQTRLCCEQPQFEIGFSQGWTSLIWSFTCPRLNSAAVIRELAAPFSWQLSYNARFVRPICHTFPSVDFSHSNKNTKYSCTYCLSTWLQRNRGIHWNWPGVLKHLQLQALLWLLTSQRKQPREKNLNVTK